MEADYFVGKKGTSKLHPVTCLEGIKEKHTYSSFSSLALDGVSSQHQAAAALPPRMTQYPLGGPRGWSEMVKKNSSRPDFDPRTVF